LQASPGAGGGLAENGDGAGVAAVQLGDGENTEPIVLLLLFFLAHKTLVRGVALTGLKAG
jgi:hypothetical protein